jgi:hypothetical protein
MLDWRIACIVFSISFLLLTLGCSTPKKDTVPIDPLARCTASCEKSYIHTIGNLSNGTCYCPCEDGYRHYNRTCISQQQYDYLHPAICESECVAKYPHTTGLIKGKDCTCPCEKGYVSYNSTCITPKDFEDLAPVLCKKEFPVLKIYDWSYKAKTYYVYLCYENETKADTVEDRRWRQDYWNFVGDPYSNSTVSLMTDLLMNISKREDFSQYEQVDFAIAFVQSLPYTYDNVTTPYDDYPRFPSETIYADGGDCEDTSILMAAVLKKMGYDVVLLSLPQHVATGVSCDPSDFNHTVSSYPYNGRDYCYLETTGENYGIGELPISHIGQEVDVIPLRDPQPDLYFGEEGKESAFQYVYSYNRYDTYVNVTKIRVDNYGTVLAKNVKIGVELDSKEDGRIWDEYTVSAGDIKARSYYEAYVTNLHVPSGDDFRVHIVVHGDNFKPVESTAGWVTWH